MPKTHLPAHMDSVRQNFRPKHQLLILKCYPRLPKNSAVEAKPNGSELSYLLYYASTRRSKLQKVGAFLERKTASDVYRSQSARVQVTLIILTALLENKMVGAGSGFALIAPYILRIIREILQHTNDTSLIEAAAQTWDVFCQHQDRALLAADHEYRDLYEQVVRRYAALAHKEGVKKLGNSTVSAAVQDQIRLREAGLEAIKSILVSDNLASESGRQLDITVPAILSNLRGSDDRYLVRLFKQCKSTEDVEKEKAINRRMSLSASRTLTSISDDMDPRQAEGTASDADEIAEEQIAVLALNCLRQVFASDNRSQARTATLAILRYLSDLQTRPRTAATAKLPSDIANSSWSKKLVEMCTAWIPVQDRFILILTTVEMLIGLPLKDSDMNQHLLYTNLINHVLRSDLNLIGLSVMDILLSLIQQILRILHLSGPQNLEGSISSSTEDIQRPPPTAITEQPPEGPTASPKRIQLTERLRDCVANLATHVYYTDQVADMIAAILLRLKPNPVAAAPQNPIMTAAAIEDPRLAVVEVASNVSLAARERSNSLGNFFSFDTARYIALEAVRDILKVVNSTKSLSSNGVAESRNKVPISIWEGTQWLLRDPSPSVRRMYVDALNTWLTLETKSADFHVKQPERKPKKSTEAMARRAISNASNKNRGQSKKATSTFLQLLHLAVYENVLEYAETSESDLLILHLLLSTLARKLGINSVQGGLPMVFALQDDIAKTTSETAKVRTASLVHGYFWILTEVFDFDMTSIGREITGEIARRKEGQVWLTGVNVPPAPLNTILDIPSATNSSYGKEDVKAFTDRKGLVDHISQYYTITVGSPPTSPPGSPARSPSRPFNSIKVERVPSSYLTANTIAPNPFVLPEKITDSMMEQWSREACLAAIAIAAPKSISLSGSRTSPSQALLSGNNQQILSAAAAAAATGQTRNPSLAPSVPPIPSAHRQQAFGKRLHSESPGRRGSPDGSTYRPPSSSAEGKSTFRVDDLKRVLAGGTKGLTSGTLSGSVIYHDDTGSESMVDVGDGEFGSENGSLSFASASFHKHEADTPQASVAIPATVPEDDTAAPTPSTYYTPATELPPVLSLPHDAFADGRLDLGSSSSFPVHNGTATSTTTTATTAAESLPPPSIPQNSTPPSRDGRVGSRSRPTTSRKDLRTLLAGIGAKENSDVAPEEKRFASVRRPPY